ncbi:hypothetical protein L0U88_10720 [Flavihumibacter sp. RY-1]|uniref:Uncharacterized protein n=1 Tax=Flavihumibacter fluminis TaxID=2909236 RepID=A0ABS9BJ02_9BACT|nr:hypothetical protein [Flavihumibacter fluminis]MCF1715098.1 hypothetical protein [Flavihumibacter fluminis]
MNIAGKWSGTFTYGDGYTPEMHGKTVQFELILKMNGIEITGTITDEETKHLFRSAGNIFGFIENKHIFFTKQYPNLCLRNSLSGEMEVFDDEPAYDINYSGQYQSEGFFAGEWEIPPFTLYFVTENLEISGSGT